MNEAQFVAVAEELVTAIEDAIDESGANLDYENNGGVLTILCEDSDSQVIVSRQTPLQQIWVAARSGGYHCSDVDNRWVCSSTGEELQALLSRACSEQSDQAVELNWT